MPATRTRVAVRVTGVVQGVGFRPFVHRLATELVLTGHVGNDAAGVFVELEGRAEAVERFVTRLRDEAPPLARVEDMTVTTLAASEGREAADGFRIVESPTGGAVATLVPADVGICDDCRRELFDPADRRYRHPFITCTNCGPRFTITRSLPYDRPSTTMAGFEMCATCSAEYHDPTDRRFHAQPIACPGCGPAVRYRTVPYRSGVHVQTARLRAGSGRDTAGSVLGTEPALVAAQRTLAGGGTVAVKGVGGFHLACDATAPAAVDRLRARKQRPDKPFAVMVADLATAQAIVHLDGVETAALTSPQRPVVLARSRHSALVADAVAPHGNPLLGVMLPSSPLHELLLAPSPDTEVVVPPVLVMTSGNLSGEPICFTDEDADARLAGIVDGFLTHDRPIHVPCDDSVVRIVDDEVVPIRRSRGDTPLPLQLPADAAPMLAVGAELKNTVGVARGHQAWLSQHIGDLGDLETLRTFERTAEQLARFFEVTPAHVAVDPHPAYATHAWARRHHPDRLEPVQHHHAHAAALLAEHDLPAGEVVLVATFDGTGYGTDHTVWGGELLLASQRRADRAAHLLPVPLPGGDSAVANPARMALAALWAAGLDWDADLPCTAALTRAEQDLLRRQLERDLGCVPTSSAGRLFDAVSALLGVRQHITYEGQAAIELEWLADAFTTAGYRDEDAPRYHLDVGDRSPITLDAAPLLGAIVAELRTGTDRRAIAAGFHLAVADAIVEVADRVAADGGPRTVGLTGGVFQNAWLTTRTRTRLAAHDHPVLTHRLVPPNDGGLAYGQLAAVAARLTASDSD
ncbi:MAG: carbamoyltransferase HypF [Nitriliruptoraceae bacterium]